MKKLFGAHRIFAKLVILSLALGNGPMKSAFAQDEMLNAPTAPSMPEISTDKKPAMAALLPPTRVIPREFDPAIANSPLSAPDPVVVVAAEIPTPMVPVPLAVTPLDKDGNPLPTPPDPITISTLPSSNPMEAKETYTIEMDSFAELVNEINEKTMQIEMVQSQIDMIMSELDVINHGIDERNAIVKDLDKVIADLEKEKGIISDPQLKEQNKMLLNQAVMQRDMILADLVTLQKRLDQIAITLTDLYAKLVPLQAKLIALQEEMIECLKKIQAL